MIKKGLPSWIDPNFVDEDIPEYMKKQREKRLKEEGKKKKSPFQIY